ncbi:trigger factor [Alphaproteobacteria bacterium endosymbiont of Tiliacea citrago]|uniref:trigger factor n=1 Tax=Alphaproteobacteria bacterium endosymbiont of Tiliacea citrago TaxID=3077944 RepID=UPI00313D4530
MSVSKLEPREITFKLDEKASTEINKIYSVFVPIEFLKEWAKDQSAPGFRQGKVPLRLLKKDEFLKRHLSNLLNKIKKQDNIEDIFASNYIIKTFDLDSDIEVVLSIEKVPNVPKINFKNISVKTFKALISDENIQNGIKNYANYNAKAGDSVSRPSEKGDFVDLELEIEDFKMNQTEKNKQSIRLGSNTFIPLIENALTGQNIDFQYSHKPNQDIEIRLKIKEIKESVPLTHEEMLDKLNVSNKPLEEFFKSKLELESQLASKNLILETIKKVILDSEFEVPLSAIQKEYKKALDQTLNNLNYIKDINLEEFIKNKLGISLKEFEANLTNIAAAHAKIRFMYYTIAHQQNIKIEEDEINYAINSQIRFFNNNIEQTKKFYEENELAREEMLENILFSKIAEHLIHKVQKLAPQEISLDELYKINIKDLEYTINESEELNEEKVKIEDSKNSIIESEDI